MEVDGGGAVGVSFYVSLTLTHGNPNPNLALPRPPLSAVRVCVHLAQDGQVEVDGGGAVGVHVEAIEAVEGAQPLAHRHREMQRAAPRMRQIRRRLQPHLV